jgi:hypothetical protein
MFIKNNLLHLNSQSFGGMITLKTFYIILLGVDATTSKPKGFFYTKN